MPATSFKHRIKVLFCYKKSFFYYCLMKISGSGSISGSRISSSSSNITSSSSNSSNSGSSSISSIRVVVLVVAIL